MANLYYITGETDDGFSLDLFARAVSPQQAYELWRGQHSDYAEDYSQILTDQVYDESDLRIFELRDVKDVGVIDWHTNDLKVVAYAGCLL